MELTPSVAPPIFLIRNRQVILDSDLAALFGVSTRRLNEQLRRNQQRFPEDFAFLLTPEEAGALMSQIATSNKGRGGRRQLERAVKARFEGYDADIDALFKTVESLIEGPKDAKAVKRIGFVP